MVGLIAIQPLIQGKASCGMVFAVRLHARGAADCQSETVREQQPVLAKAE
jgi:hypothetical protein